MGTAILVDGGYFLRRFPKVFPDRDALDPVDVGRTIFWAALGHLRDDHAPGGQRELYRIYFYDCPPLTKKIHHPISRKALDLARTPQANFRLGLHEELRKMRKCALRLGHLGGDDHWNLKKAALENLLSGSRRIEDLQDEDFTYEAIQKGVDMRIGLDIASMAFKHQVDQVVLISGDSDFVPAAKLARREGIDFILDPMWKSVHPALLEHIDGLRSTAPNPAYANAAYGDSGVREGFATGRMDVKKEMGFRAEFGTL